MGKQFAKIESEHKAFIERQKIFFVASAPPKGKINVSPKGLSSFRVLGDNDVAYLDCTGSGSETRAHLMAADDKRLTIMFCAFEGDPVILRLYGGSLVRYWTAQGIDNLRKYWGLKNMKSIDGLPTSFAPDSMAPPH